MQTDFLSIKDPLGCDQVGTIIAVPSVSQLKTNNEEMNSNQSGAGSPLKQRPTILRKRPTVISRKNGPTLNKEIVADTITHINNKTPQNDILTSTISQNINTSNVAITTNNYNISVPSVTTISTESKKGPRKFNKSH